MAVGVAVAQVWEMVAMAATRPSAIDQAQAPEVRQQAMAAADKARGVAAGAAVGKAWLMAAMAVTTRSATGQAEAHAVQARASATAAPEVRTHDAHWSCQ